MPPSRLTLTWDDQDRPLITIEWPQPDGDSPLEAEPESWLVDLAGRIPDASAEHLKALLALNEDVGAVSLAALADAVGVEKKVIDGWNRNLGRSIKAVVRDHGFLRLDQEDGTQQLFDFKWNQDENCWLYVIPEKYRAGLTKGLEER